MFRSLYEAISGYVPKKKLKQKTKKTDLVGDGKNIKPVLRTIYTCNPDYEFPIHKYSTYNSKYPAVSDCDIQTGLYRSCTSLISKHSKDFIDTVQENQIINCKLKQRTSSTTNMQHLANEKKQNQRSKKIFDEIKKMRPSKSETFTYVTFSNDNKTTNKTQVDASEIKMSDSDYCSCRSDSFLSFCSNSSYKESSDIFELLRSEQAFRSIFSESSNFS